MPDLSVGGRIIMVYTTNNVLLYICCFLDSGFFNPSDDWVAGMTKRETRKSDIISKYL